jgi:hypothetical protein
LLLYHLCHFFDQQRPPHVLTFPNRVVHHPHAQWQLISVFAQGISGRLALIVRTHLLYRIHINIPFEFPRRADLQYVSHENRIPKLFAAILADSYDPGHLFVALMLRNITLLRMSKPFHHINDQNQVPMPPRLTPKQPKLFPGEPFILPNLHKELAQKLELLAQTLKLNIKILTRAGQIPIQIRHKRIAINPPSPMPKHGLNLPINLPNKIILLNFYTFLVIPVRPRLAISFIQKRVSLAYRKLTNLGHS